MSQPLPISAQPWLEPAAVIHIQHVLKSYQRCWGRPLLQTAATPEATAIAAFTAPFVLLSHGTEASPILNYGNQMALDLWEMSWAELTATPSRQTAEADQQPDRDRFLRQVEAQGYAEGYRGRRVSKTGRRFWIEDALLWNVVDESGARIGQAATFAQWQVVTGQEQA
jgi:hypothetical protein